MVMAAYRVAPTEREVAGDARGRAGHELQQEGAYEVAVAEAAGPLPTGHEIRIEVVD